MFPPDRSSRESIGDASDHSVEEEALVVICARILDTVLNIYFILFHYSVATPSRKGSRRKATTPPVTPTPNRMTRCDQRLFDICSLADVFSLPSCIGRKRAAKEKESEVEDAFVPMYCRFLTCTVLL